MNQNYNGNDGQNNGYQDSSYQPNDGYQDNSYQPNGVGRNSDYQNGSYQSNDGYQNSDYQPNDGYQNSSYQSNGGGQNNSYQPSAGYTNNSYANNTYQNYQPYGNIPPYADSRLELEEPVKVGEWVLTFVLMMIPCVNIIMMFVWAFSSTEKKSKSNFFKAYLIFFAISMALMVVVWFGIIMFTALMLK